MLSKMPQMVTPEAQPGIGCLIPPGFHLGPVSIPLTPLCHCKHSCQLPSGCDMVLPHWPMGSRNGPPQRNLRGEGGGAETRPFATVPSACEFTTSLPKETLRLLGTKVHRCPWVHHHPSPVVAFSQYFLVSSA